MSEVDQTENTESVSHAVDAQSGNASNALLDTNNTEYIVRYNLFDATERVAGLFDLETGHANITLIQRDGNTDKTIGGGNFGVNAGNSDANNDARREFQGDKDSFVNPFDHKLDGFLGVDNKGWQGQGKAIYEQTVTPEQFQDIQDHIVSYTGDLNGDPVDINYNVAASVLSLEEQHSCYSFTQDIFEIAGGKGRLIEQFSESELAKVDNLIETVHGDIPKIPERAIGKIKDAADAVSDRAEAAIEKVRGGAEGEPTHLNESEQGASLVPTNAPLGVEANIEHTIDGIGSTPSFVPFGQAVQQFASDRELLRASDPEAVQLVTQAANHPEAEAMFVRLNENGIEHFPSEALEGDTPEDRIGNILVQAQEIHNTIDAERTIEPENSYIQTAPTYEEEYDYSFGG